MTTEELKRDIHQLVDSVQDDITLVDLHAAFALIIEQNDMPLNTSDPALILRMKQSVEQAQRSEYITNEEMKRQVQQWLGK